MWGQAHTGLASEQRHPSGADSASFCLFGDCAGLGTAALKNDPIFPCAVLATVHFTLVCCPCNSLSICALVRAGSISRLSGGLRSCEHERGGAGLA